MPLLLAESSSSLREIQRPLGALQTVGLFGDSTPNCLFPSSSGQPARHHARPLLSINRGPSLAQPEAVSRVDVFAVKKSERRCQCKRSRRPGDVLRGLVCVCSGMVGRSESSPCCLCHMCAKKTSHRFHVRAEGFTPDLVASLWDVDHLDA